MGKRLFVGSLPYSTMDEDLRQLFAQAGTVDSAVVINDRDTGQSKGFGFVVMSTIEEAKRAVDTLHDKEFMGRKLVVSGAKTNERVS